MTDSTRYALKPTLRVGQVWKSGEGKKVTITQKTDDADDRFPIVGSDGRSYTSSGGHFYLTRSKFDLIELLSDAPTDEWQAVYHAAAQLDPIACCLLELRDRLAALEAAAVTPTPTAAEPSTTDVSMEELAAPRPSMDRDAVAAGWRKIREEREATTADGLSPVEAAPQAQQGVPSAPELWELARVAKEQDRTGTGGPEWDDSHHIHQRDHIVAHRALFAHGFQRGLDVPRAPQGVTYEELVCLLREVEDSSLERLWKSSNQLQARHLLAHDRIGPLLRGEGASAPRRVVLPEEPPAPPSNPKWFFAGDFRYVQGRRDGWKAARAEVERQQGGQADG